MGEDKSWKKRMTFELDIPDERNEVLALAVVPAINAVMDAQQSDRSSFFFGESSN